VRQSRVRRHRGVVVRLTGRDRQVLEVLGRFRIARTKDLVLTCFSGVHPMTASMRLRRLFDAGLLVVHSSDPARENVYQLGPRASEWRTGQVPRGSLAHHLAIVRAWSLLAASVRDRLELELARSDWEIREEVMGSEVIPDLFMVFSGRALAIEVDLGTEPQGVLRRKLQIYERLDRLFGYPFVVSVMADRFVPGVHCWSGAEGPDSCYDLLLR